MSENAQPSDTTLGALQALPAQFRLLLAALSLFCVLLTGGGLGATLNNATGSGVLAQKVEAVGKRVESAVGEIQDELEAQGVRLAGVERSVDRIEERSGDRWTRTDMQLWVAEMRRRNPTWDVPEVRGQ